MGVLSDQATAIANVIATVPNVGLTYNYQPVPLSSDWTDYVNSFTTVINTQRVVRAWAVAYLGEGRAYRTIAIGATKTYRTVRWKVRGYFGFADGSEATFRDLAEQVVAALDKAVSLNGTALEHDPCQVDMPNDGQGISLGGVLCHLVEITLSAKVEETLTTN